MAGELQGRTALVTGASRGIGLAVARELVEARAWVAMVARTPEPLAHAAQDVGGHAIPADVSTTEGVHTLATYLGELLGDAPDLIVSAAGAFSLARLDEASPQEFAAQIDANLRGPFLLMRAFLPAMLRRRAGHFVTIGSVAGRAAFPENGAYAASKFGVRGLHEVLRAEVRGTGVRATLIEPAATDTPLWDPIDPDARPDLPSRASMLRPRDVARAVLFAATQPPGVQVSSIAVEAAG
ncbi:MAG: SDR family oxidoreductase [Gemmatimonadetes bacterium]|nr:SDR family oxidoreductase [Gemmatimonadota bacterium]